MEQISNRLSNNELQKQYIRLRVAVSLHDALHEFRKGRGTGTATPEAKLDQ